MAEWQKQIFAINLIVGDLERSKAFYREVFGLTPWTSGRTAQSSASETPSSPCATMQAT